MKGTIRLFSKLGRVLGVPRASPVEQPGRKYELIFIGGCPRSGTSAVQLFLGGHPKIATARETHVFDYVVPFLRHFRSEAQWLKCDDGIRNLLSESDIMNWCRTFSEGVFKKILGLKPGAALVLEKTPDNTMFGCEIAELFPNSCFVSVIRDPRGVAASCLAASRQPWGAWAPATATAAAQRWLRAVRTLPLVENAFGRRHIYTRYEDFADPKSAARGNLIGFLALQFPEQAFQLSQFALPPVGAAVDLGLSEDRNNPAKENRTDFFRRGLPEGWKTELARADIDIIERLCSPEMQKFGYIVG